MRVTLKMLLALVFLVGVAPRAISQVGLPGSGTPASTAKIASSATFIDVLGIKIGMPAEDGSRPSEGK